jgi:hypothetical protein
MNFPQYQTPDMSALSAKYLKDQPTIDIETDPAKLYEGQVGGMRQDVQSAMTEGGRQAISQAAASGREVADVMARYLPEAVKGAARGYADVATGASQQAQQGQVAKSELELKRGAMAQEMARFDASAQQQQYQFMTQLRTEYQMHREQMQNNLRVAQSQASSQAQLQSIQNAHAMQMQQLKNQFAAKAQQFGEQQANARHSLGLQLYDKHFSAEQQRLGRAQTIAGVAATREQSPEGVLGGRPPIGTQGTGTVRFGGTTYGMTPSGFQPRDSDPATQFDRLYKQQRSQMLWNDPRHAQQYFDRR